MSEQSQPTEQLSIILKSAHARLIGILTVVVLFLGVVAECLSISTSYYNWHKVKCDTALSVLEVAAKGPGIFYAMSSEERAQYIKKHPEAAVFENDTFNDYAAACLR